MRRHRCGVINGTASQGKPVETGFYENKIPITIFHSPVYRGFSFVALALMPTPLMPPTRFAGIILVQCKT
jgi:hypothetical protein